MCDFCHRHGEGKKWYLAATSYSEELFTDAARRSIADVLAPLGREPRPEAAPEAQVAMLRSLPKVARWVARRHQQDVHWGQVVPLEDALAVVDLVDWVVRLPCVCRSRTIGDRNARYCFGVGLAPLEEPLRQLFRELLDPALSVERLTKEEARKALTELDQRGAMHSVWTFKSPFVGGLCNCDRDCYAYRVQTFGHLQVMFRAESVAQVDAAACTGCRRCMRQCLFGALAFSLETEKCAVNELACYGCGVCRAACQHEAIALAPRASVPAAARVWGL